MKNRIISSTLMLASLIWPMHSMGEDIDLFMGPTDLADASAPNVLFIVDNTGNWTAPFEDEKAALQAVFNGIADRVRDPDDDFAVNIGVMMFTETGGADNNVSGAYVRAAVRPMGDLTGDKRNGNDEVYADLYSDLIGGFHERDDKANAGAAGLAMAEAYYYFAQQAPYAGNNKAKTDWGDNEAGGTGTFNEYFNQNNPSRATCCAESHPVWELPGNALTTKSSTLYNSPIAPGACGKNYIIWISNGATQDPKAGGSDPIPKQLLQTAIDNLGRGDISQIGLSPSGSEDTWADEWARFMNQSPEGVTVFAVDILPKNTGQGPGWSRLLKSMSEDVTGGKYYKVENANSVATELAESINDAIDRILAVNTVFASVALPAASNAQSTFLNQVFIGQFRPDKDAKPQWPGNLKQYRLGIVGSDIKVVDADGDSIVDSGTGFIEACTKSYWSSIDTYWSGDLALSLENAQICTEGGSNSAESNAPDGPLVEKGGQAQQLRAISPASSRRVYTCDPDTDFTQCSSLTLFDDSNNDITAALLGVDATDPDEPEDTINWARGADVEDEDGDGVFTDMRASVHGDVVHSRPVAINYNTDASPAVVVFYSGNDGMLRAVNGNRTDVLPRTEPAGTAPGQEIWSFMPPEFYPYIEVLRRNDDTINFPSSAVGSPTSGISKPYGIDGPITAFEGDIPGVGNDRKYLYTGMRRAGRILYAFDVTNISSPQLLWKKGCSALDPTDASNMCTAGWEDMGQTWSQPNILYANGYPTSTVAPADRVPLLIMGGGYDDCEDTDDNSVNHSCPVDDTGAKVMGNGIYILNAQTGAILKTFSTERPVPGAVTVVPIGDSIDSGIMYAYGVDTGGNIYRIHGGTVAAPAPIGTAHPSTWEMTKIASLGCDDTSSCTANRKFLFGPDVVRDEKTAGQLAILVGSGDREKPLTVYEGASSVQNYFFSVFDQPANPGWLYDNPATVPPTGPTCGSDIICLDSLSEVSLTGVASGSTIKPQGWRFPLATGEQVVTGAITVADIANFSTHVPAQPTDACASDLGRAYTYNLDFREADGGQTEIVKGGLVPTPVAGMVIIDGKKYPFCIGCGGEESAIGAKLVGSGIKWTQPKSRVYWNIQQ
jgi:type IV pilus assembly protein PilY1